MNDHAHDDHRFTNETYSSRNTPWRMVFGIGFISSGLLAVIFLSLVAIDRAPLVGREIAAVVRPFNPMDRYHLVRELWDQKLDKIILNLKPK